MSHGITPSPALSGAEVEGIEVAGWIEIQSHVDAAFRADLGIEVHPTDGGVSLVARNIDMLAMNRTLGLGFRTPLTEQVLDAIIARYRAAGVARFVLQWSPAAEPAEATQWILDRGFRALPRMVKLGRRTNGPLLPVETSLEIVRIGVEDAQRFAETAVCGHELDARMAAGFSSTIGRPGWIHYFAMDGSRPVSVAALFTRGKAGWLGLGATIPSHRGRGAQSALLARRVRDAEALGCEWVACETTEEAPDRPNPSYRNMRRLGFDVVHVRPNYLLDLRASK